MIVKRLSLADGYIVIISMINRVDNEEILEKLSRYGGLFVIVSRKSVISTRQIESAAYNFLELKGVRWIRNEGLRFISLLVGERQIRDALNIAKPEEEDVLLIWLTDTIEKLSEMEKLLNSLDVQIRSEVKFSSHEEFSRLYKFSDKANKEELEKIILEKQAVLKLNFV